MTKFELKFKFDERNDENIERLNAVLATIPADSCTLEDEKVYLVKSTVRKEKNYGPITGPITERRSCRFGLDFGKLVCEYADEEDESKVKRVFQLEPVPFPFKKELEFMQNWREENPETVIRTVQEDGTMVTRKTSYYSIRRKSDFIRLKGIDVIIWELIKSLNKATDWKLANQIISSVKEKTSNFDEYQSHCYHYKDYFIQVAPAFAIRDHVRGLKRVKDFGLSIAPEIIKYCEFPGGSGGVLITQIPGAEGELSDHYNETSSFVTLKAKKQLLKDLDTLTDHGLIALQLHDKENWQYFVKAEKIVVSDWRNDYIQITVDEDTKLAHKKHVTKLLGLNAES